MSGLRHPTGASGAGSRVGAEGGDGAAVGQLAGVACVGATAAGIAGVVDAVEEGFGIAGVSPDVVVDLDLGEGCRQPSGAAGLVNQFNRAAALGQAWAAAGVGDGVARDFGGIRVCRQNTCRGRGSR